MKNDMQVTQEFRDKVDALAARISGEYFNRLEADCRRSVGHVSESHFACFCKNSQTKITYGKKYVRVDVDGAGKYMIDADGNIFGIKGYGVIHLGHRYGTLDTINEFYWGGFRAVRKTDL